MVIRIADTYAVASGVIRAMDAANVDYYIGGSMASSVHGEARLTQDLDFIVRLHPSQVPILVSTLGDAYYADADMIREAIEFRSSANVIDLTTGLKADIIVPEESPFVESEFARKTLAKLAAHPDAPEGYVCSAEDIVLQKLRWYRMGGEVSDRQWRDVKGVLVYQAARLDSAYLDKWAAELGIADLLARVREDAERPKSPPRS
jgi:hypothetical protein